MKLRINQSGISDNTIISPINIFEQINNCSQSIGLSALVQFKYQGSVQSKNVNNQIYDQLSQVSRKKKQSIGLKKLIRSQKIQNIKRKFIAKLKLNNINSPAVQFEPYYITQTQYFYDKKGFQIHDWVQKVISGLIVLTILLCVFIDSTYIAFPEIFNYDIIKSFQIFSYFLFTFQFISSMLVIKMVDGKKIQTISAIFKYYLSDGLIIDLAYILVLNFDMISNAGVFRLIILLKLPQCFQRIQKIQNSLINTFYKQQYWGLAKVFLLNFSLSHVLCILLTLMSKLDSTDNWMIKLNIQDAIWYQKYIWAYYWGTTIMLTVGFGDITPSNHQQAICIVLIQTFSCLALAYNINCVGNLISNIKSQDIEKNRNIKTFKILSNRNNLSEDLQLKIHNYIEQSTNIRKKFNFQQQSKFISTLPRQLKADFLKQSNKKIFQNLIFFKNLTQKTLLNFAQLIQMKICHPQQVIKKRGEISGVMILKQGKIGLCTKMNGSDFNSVTIQAVSIKENQNPFLLSLDFVSNDRAIYQLKSEEYSILYYLDKETTMECLKIGQLDFQHFCFIRDKARNLDTDFQVYQCQNCKINHSKFQCPKLHYCPLKKHVVDKYLHTMKICKSRRIPVRREKKNFNAFSQLQNNIQLFQIKEENKYEKYASYKRSMYTSQKGTATDEFHPKQSQNLLISFQLTQGLKKIYNTLATQKKIQVHYMAGVLKDQLEKIISHQSEVWLIQSDQVKNFKFYFISYNAGTLEYLHRKEMTNSIFS